VIGVLLPDSTGIEVAEECEQRYPECRVLLTSAWDFDGESDRVPEQFDVVPKAALMERLFIFLDACRSTP
jgi:hypothetical protein